MKRKLKTGQNIILDPKYPSKYTNLEKILSR